MLLLVPLVVLVVYGAMCRFSKPFCNLRWKKREEKKIKSSHVTLWWACTSSSISKVVNLSLVWDWACGATRAHQECICRFVSFISSTFEIKTNRNTAGGGVRGAAIGRRFCLKFSVEASQLWSYFPPALYPPERRLLGFDLFFQLTLNELCSLLPQTPGASPSSSSSPPRPLWQRGRHEAPRHTQKVCLKLCLKFVLTFVLF